MKTNIVKNIGCHLLRNLFMAWLEYLLPLIFLTPPCATALVVIGLRQLFRRRMLSPVDQRQLREPGQSLRNRLDSAQAQLFLVGALGPIIVMMPLVYGMGRMLFAPRQDWIEWSFYGLLCTVAVMVACGLLMRLYYRISHLRLSLSCALSVHQTLLTACRRLTGPASRPLVLLHDVPGDGFNIGHIVLAREQIFAIITKGRLRPPDIAANSPVRLKNDRLLFPHSEERRSLRETRRAARWLSEYLTRCGYTDVPIRAILVLPGWQIDTVAPLGNLDVVNEAGLSHLIENRHGAPMDEARLTAIERLLIKRTGDADHPQG